MNDKKLTVTERRLLRLLAAWDDGDGVQFEDAPAGRCVHPQTGARFNERTFRPLDAAGLVDVGNGRSDPVKILPAGRKAVGA